MKTYPTFFGGEVKEEWGSQVGVGEQVMSKFECVMNITLKKIIREGYSYLNLRYCALIYKYLYITRFFTYTLKGWIQFPSSSSIYNSMCSALDWNPFGHPFPSLPPEDRGNSGSSLSNFYSQEKHRFRNRAAK